MQIKDTQLRGRLGNVLFLLAHQCSESALPVFSVTMQQVPIVSDLRRAFGIDLRTRFVRRFEPDGQFNYWQSESLFDVEKARKMFRFRQEFSRDVDAKFGNRDFSDFVSISVRRGDYVTRNGMWLPMDADYYASAYRKYFDGVPCLVSSDDIKWCKDNFKFPDAIYANDITTSPIELLYILSRCRNSIGSASTFSWWVAWLDEVPGSRHVFPDRWYDYGKLNGLPPPLQGIDQILPERWTRHETR